MTDLQTVSSKVINAHQRIDGKANRAGDVFSGAVELQSYLQLDGISTPATPPSGDSIIYGGSNGVPQVLTDSGFSGILPITAANVQTFTQSTQNTTNPVSASWTIPANDSNVGTFYRITLYGTGSYTSGTVIMQTNAFGGSHANAVFNSMPSAFNFEATGVVEVITTGITGTSKFITRWLISTTNGGTASPTVGIGVTNQTIDTTSSTTMSIQVNLSNPASASVSGIGATFERLGA